MALGGKATTEPVAIITYNATAGVLTGTIGREYFCIRAYSGGARGSTNSNIWESNLKSTQSTTKKKSNAAGNRGGTLPAGHYLCHYVKDHAHFHECIWLERCSDAEAIKSPFSAKPINHHRGNDFYIHGRGSLGSDGCIVPKNPEERLALNKAVKGFHGKVYVKVTGVGYELPAEKGMMGGMSA